MKNKFMAVATASLLSVGVVENAIADDIEDPIVKCYGIAKSGKNDCAHARGAHGCAAQATINYDPCEWKAVAKSECLSGIKEGGKTIIGTLTPENCKGALDPEGEADAAAEKESGVDANEANTAITSSIQDNASVATGTTNSTTAAQDSSSAANSAANASVDTSKVPVTDATASLAETGADAPSDDENTDSDH